MRREEKTLRDEQSKEAGLPSAPSATGLKAARRVSQSLPGAALAFCVRDEEAAPDLLAAKASLRSDSHPLKQRQNSQSPEQAGRGGEEGPTKVAATLQTAARKADVVVAASPEASEKGVPSRDSVQTATSSGREEAVLSGARPSRPDALTEARAIETALRVWGGALVAPQETPPAFPASATASSRRERSEELRRALHAVPKETSRAPPPVAADRRAALHPSSSQLSSANSRRASAVSAEESKKKPLTQTDK